ncbi:hypothetical protein [Streptomyces triticiradicis]|uniref:Uncharacterized protein n=1 Tax=Streptomyces triticiradicis TaxID=2651189 RepID=A0A7J5D6P7_9ACTN|nr:hypothetical protein [Streptomyces triticiradicis]KAB1980778.1 hypothetical protein F8144_33180 [Streptomyces triticiradicis]
MMIVAVAISSHPLTSLMLISALVAMSLPRRNRRVAPPAPAGTVAPAALRDTAVARPYLSENLNDFLGSLLKPDTNVVSRPAALGVAAPGQVAVRVDRDLSAAVFVLAAIAFPTRPWVRRTGLPLLVVAPLPVLVANAHGREMIFHACLFALPAASPLITALLLERGRRPRLQVPAACPLLLARLGGLMFSYYGKESANYFTREEVAAGRFVAATAPPGSTVASLTSAVPGLHLRHDGNPQVQSDAQDIDDRQRPVNDPVKGPEGFVQRASPTRPAYIILSRAQTADLYQRAILPGGTPDTLVPRAVVTTAFLLARPGLAASRWAGHGAGEGPHDGPGEGCPDRDVQPVDDGARRGTPVPDGHVHRHPGAARPRRHPIRPGTPSVLALPPKPGGRWGRAPRAVPDLGPRTADTGRPEPPAPE